MFFLLKSKYYKTEESQQGLSPRLCLKANPHIYILIRTLSSYYGGGGGEREGLR